MNQSQLIFWIVLDIPFASPFDDGATCKKLRVFFNADKQQIQIDWKFDGKYYEVYV